MNDSPIANRRRLHFIIGTIIGLCVIATLIVFILKLSTASPTTIIPVANVASIPTIVSDYAKSGTIAALSPSEYIINTSAPSTTIYYKEVGHNYAVELASESTVLFNAKSKSETSNSATVLTQTDAFMKNNGLPQTVKNQQYNHIQANYTTYANKSIVCELIDGTLNPYVKGSYAFACASTQSVTSLYKSADDLMTIYKKSHEINDFGDIGIQTLTSGNKSLAIMNVRAIKLSMTNPDFKTLLFVSVDGNWQYISELTAQTSGVTLTYVRTPDLKLALANTTYGAFLTKNLP